MDTLSTENLYNGNSIRKKNKREKSKKAIAKDEGQSLDQYNIDTQLANRTAEGNAIIKKLKTKDKVQTVGQTKNDSEIRKNLAEGNETVKKPKVKDNPQIFCNTYVDMGPSLEDPAEGNATVKDTEFPDQVRCMLPSNMNTGPTVNMSEGNANVKKTKKRREIVKAELEDEVQNRMDAINLAGGKAMTKKPKIKDEDEVQQAILSKIDMGSTENPAHGNVCVENPKIQMENLSQGNGPDKQRKKRKRMKAKFDDEVHGAMHTRSIENLTEGNATTNMSVIKDEVQSVSQVQMDAGSKEIVAEGNVTMKNPKSQDEIQGIYKEKMDIRPTQNFSEGNVNVKRRKRRKTDKAEALEEIPSSMDAGSAENRAGVIVSMKISETRDEVQSMGPKVMDAEPAENISKGIVTVENPKDADECQGTDKLKIYIGPAMNFTKEHVNEKRKRKRRSLKNTKDVGESTSQGGTMSSFSVNGLSQISNGNTLDEEIGHTEQRGAISSCNAFTFKDEEALCLKPAFLPSIRRKLLVLDLNGLLADIAGSHPEHCTEAIKISKHRSVIRRPFCHDFLKFCFENFDVGIWSSRSRIIVDRVVDCLLEDQKDKLQFCWDTTYCTHTGFKTLGKCSKPLVCKELRKIWENNDPNCPWKKGDYDESNTLLLDDSPYKALLNPLHTAIFPHPYQYSYESDNSLGPGGDLRVYLEGLVSCENVQKYVEQHPFGQRPITEKNVSWGFYKRVMEQVSKPVTRKCRRRRS